MKLEMKRLNPSAVLPAYSTDGSAGMDLHALLPEQVNLKPNERSLIPTGLSVKLPENTVGLIYARSGLATKYGITLSNCVGVIDSDYTGELKIGLINLSDQEYVIHNGDRVAQLVITPYCKCVLTEQADLEKTGRGSGGFGSTGR